MDFQIHRYGKGIFCLFLSIVFNSDSLIAKTQSNWPFWYSKTKKHYKNIRCFYPLHEWETNESIKNFWLRPFSWQKNVLDKKEAYFLYPLGTHKKSDRYDEWSLLFTLISFEKNESHHRFRFFPFYFRQKGIEAKDNYEGIFPLGGNVKNFFGRDEHQWFCWPFWLKTYKNKEINRWFPWPFFDYRSGNAHGFGFWPLGGHFWKIENYDERYLLWPLVYNHRQFTSKGTNLKKGFLPFYAYEKSSNIEDLSIVWPIWGRRHENEPRYEEHRLLWPLWVQGRGDRRWINRWAPFYTHSRVNGLEKKWYFWPLFRILDWKQKSLYFHQEQFLYFLFWAQRQRNEDGTFLAEKTHFWPFYSYWNNGNGEIQFQSLSPFEVFFPNNEPIRQLYSPLFAFYRFHQRTDGSRLQSLFFDFIKEEKRAKKKVFQASFLIHYSSSTGNAKFEIFKGLWGYHKTPDGNTVRLFWHSFKTPSARSKKFLNPHKKL